jgi:hypothetical protein
MHPRAHFFFFNMHASTTTILQKAREKADFVTEHLLMSFFIPEQLEEEKAVEEIYNNAVRGLFLLSPACLSKSFF